MGSEMAGERLGKAIREDCEEVAGEEEGYLRLPWFEGKESDL